MVVGVLRLTLRTASARSLKDKRRIIRSLKDRVQSRLRLSVAEVGGLDEHQRCVLAVAAVAKDAGRVDELLAAAASLAERVRDAVLTDRAIEMVPFGDEGQGLRADEGEGVWV